MKKQIFTPQEFWLLHCLILMKRAACLNENIEELKDVDALVLQHSKNRTLVHLYGYDDTIDRTYETDNLFDVMARYLINLNPQEYTLTKFKTIGTLTRDLFNKYKDHCKKKEAKKALKSVSIQGHFCACYYDFIGIAGIQDLRKLVVDYRIETVSNARFFEGYYYTEEANEIKRLLLKMQVDSRKVEIFLDDFKSNSRHHYKGVILHTADSVTFEISSCEKGANGRLYAIMKIGHNPLGKLKTTDIFFASYCSVLSMGSTSSGVLGFEVDVNIVDEHSYDGWDKEIPLYFEYLLSQNDITFQRAYQQTRIRWDYSVTSLNHLISSEKKTLESFNVAKRKLRQLSGIYKGLSFNGKNTMVTVSYFLIDSEGNVYIRILDINQDVPIEYNGRIRIDNRIYKFTMERQGRKVEMLFEHRNYSSEILYGVYTGIINETICGGRIMLTKLEYNDCKLSDYNPRRVKLYSIEYQNLLKEHPNFHDFFSGNSQDEYMDDNNLIRYKTKAEEPLPMPKFKPTLLAKYEGTYTICFLYQEKDNAYIKYCPLSINKDGRVVVKSLLSDDANDYYDGRAYIQKNKLFIHLYYNNWQSYHGNLILQLPSSNKKVKEEEQQELHQFVGLYNLGNKNNPITSGRIHLIQASQDCALFNSLEVELHPCYTKPYKALCLNGSKIDLRKEFMGRNYNYIKLTKKANEGLNKKGIVRTENYANIFFKSAICTVQKGRKLGDESTINYAADLFRKALMHGWSEDKLDSYDQDLFNQYIDVFEDTIRAFSDKYLL